MVLPFAPRVARADDPPEAAAADSTEGLAQAKDLFRKGVTLLDAGDLERALEYFQRSRAIVPSAANTTNAAICLEDLGRYDEALEVYEELLLRFAALLDPEDRQNLAPKMAFLRTKVGSVDISSNVDGVVVIDRRARGKLPFGTPVRVLEGKQHVVRVFKDGYESFETRIDVIAGRTVTIDARLTPLAGAGLLRVDDPASEGFDVFVDGVRVGTAPWEGTVRLGPHVVWTRKGERGSAPGAIVVLQGQTALARPTPGDLGAPVAISVTPATAALSLGGVPLAVGAWEGRLPVGAYPITAVEEGYEGRRALLTVSPAGTPKVVLRLRLAIDAEHPRWPQSAPGQIAVTVFGGYAAGASLGSDAEQVCPSACASPSSGQAGFPRDLRDPFDPAVLGGIAGLRGGYRFRVGIAPELSVGFLGVAQSFTRFRDTTFYSRQSLERYPITYTLDDRLRLSGAFIGLGASYRVQLRSPFALIARTTTGVFLARASDPITGTASAGGETAEIQVAGRDQTLVTRMPFILPELGGEAAFGPLRLGLALGLAFFPGTGPRLGHPEVGAAPRCDAARPGAVGCAPSASILAGERVNGTFVMWLPQVSLGYIF